MLLDFDIVIAESESAEPDCGDEHQQHVYIAEVAHKEAWDDDGYDYYDATHSGGAFLLHLSFKSEVTDNLTYLHQLQSVNDFPPEHQCDKQRQQQCGS